MKVYLLHLFPRMSQIKNIFYPTLYTKIAANTIRQGNINKTQTKRNISAYISDTATQQIWDKPQNFYFEFKENIDR